MTRVIINDLPVYSKKSLFLLTKHFGKINFIDISTSTTIIDFISTKSAQNFINLIQNKLPFIKAHMYISNTIFVDRIPKNISNEIIKKYFLNFGIINSFTEHRTYFEYKSFLIQFKKSKDAINCIKNTNRKVKFKEDSEKLVVKLYDPSHLIVKKNSDDKCVFVYNLTNIDKKDFLNIFEVYGEIKSFGYRENVGWYINYVNELSALKAVKYGNNLEFNNVKMYVVLKSEKKKSD